MSIQRDRARRQWIVFMVIVALLVYEALGRTEPRPLLLSGYWLLLGATLFGNFPSWPGSGGGQKDNDG